jgi:hypothetical protein
MPKYVKPFLNTFLLDGFILSQTELLIHHFLKSFNTHNFMGTPLLWVFINVHMFFLNFPFLQSIWLWKLIIELYTSLKE